MANATFYSFKRSGKCYAEGRGTLTREAIYDWNNRREHILRNNDGKYPGLSGRGDEFHFVIIPDEDHPEGFPLMLLRKDNADQLAGGNIRPSFNIPDGLRIDKVGGENQPSEQRR